MSPAVARTGAALLLLGLALFGWKTLGLGLPAIPVEAPNLWRVELEISARGDGARGSVRAVVPSSGTHQTVFDERSASGGLVYTVRSEGTQRSAVWSGRFLGTRQLVHGFRVELAEAHVPLPPPPVEPPPEPIVARYTGPTTAYPALAPEIADTVATLDLRPATDPGARIRLLFSFVSDEIAGTPSGSDDALLTLAAREGSPVGRCRLLVSLLRAVGVPARLTLGLRLRSEGPPSLEVSAEAFLGGAWVPMSPDADFFARRPADLVLLGHDVVEPVESTGVAAVTHRYRALREHLRPEELATMMVPTQPLLARLSLYQLPLSTQEALRVLSVLTLGVLVLAVFRNVIGVPTFGTFMPVLIALALRGSSLMLGLGMVAAVIGLGVLGRLVLGRLHLLLVPRLALLFCLVVLALAGFALLGAALGTRDFAGGVLLPIVILTMLIERFSITISEEGWRPALVKVAWSTAIAVVIYPLFRSELLEHLMFGFPELVLCVMGLLVWIGGYTGYRLSDLIRFRAFAEQEPDTP